VQSLFRLDNVSFSSRGVQIVENASLSVQKGTVTAFLGKSGSGKSTLLKLTAGLLQPTFGTVYYGEQNIHTLSRMETEIFRKKCAFMFQDSALWANQNIFQNLSLPLMIHFPEMNAEERFQRIQNVCAVVGFGKDLFLRPADLSTGEQKLAGFARALICEPEILFLDECTESLDRKSRETMCQILDSFLKKGNTIVYVSHESGFISRYPGTIYIVESGKVQIKEIKKNTEADA